MSLQRPRVWSKRSGADRPPQTAVYVGRPSEWGNPYPVGGGYPHEFRKITQEDAVALYTEWIFADAQRWRRLSARTTLRGKDLVCWCAPLPCHADVLLVIANTTTDEEAKQQLGMS